MASVFDYSDYRQFLKEYYESHKALNPAFSYRYLAQKAGVNSAPFFKFILEGKRNLTKATILKTCIALKLNDREAEYFENLVFFNQAKTISDKTMYYARIVECRKPLDVKTISKERYEFYSKWYHSVVREVVTFFDFKDDYALLGQQLLPPISAREAQESITLLERLGFIERDDAGLYHQTDTIIGVKPGGHEAFIIERFQTEMLEMAIKSFDTVQRSERMSASTTFSISKATFDLFKMRTREFRKELLEIAKLDNEPDRVVQFTFNLFPLSQGKNKK